MTSHSELTSTLLILTCTLTLPSLFICLSIFTKGIARAARGNCLLHLSYHILSNSVSGAYISNKYIELLFVSLCCHGAMRRPWRPQQLRTSPSGPGEVWCRNLRCQLIFSPWAPHGAMGAQEARRRDARGGGSGGPFAKFWRAFDMGIF